MKIFPVRLYLLPLLFFTSCESPRLVFPDIDYGVVIDSSDRPLYMEASLDSTSIILPGDRVKAADSVVTMYAKTGELKFSINSTMKEMIVLNVKTGDETIIRMTDHFTIRPENGEKHLNKIQTVLEYASGETRTINWREIK